MYEIKGGIEGVAPILFNRPFNLKEGGQGGGKRTKRERLEEVDLRLHRNGKGIFLPPWNLKVALMDGAKKANLKESRKSLATYIAGSVFIKGDLLFGKESPDFIHEHWGRIPPRTGGAVIIRRPALDTGWKLPFRLTVIDDNRDANQLRIAMETAGLLVGLLSWRPEYGRFIVSEWELS